MGLLLDPAFWLCALGGVVLMRLPWPAAPMRRFGLLNLLALSFCLGPRLAAGALVFALLAWVLLRALARSPAARWLPACLAGAALLFVLHKLDLERRVAGGALLPFDLLARLAYSYVFLRFYDAARSIARGARLLDPLALLGYLAPFHMLLAGPVNVYEEHLAADGLPVAEPTLGQLLAGLDTLTTGLFYKLVLAQGLSILAFGLGGRLAPASLADSALVLLYLFFDFAGYSLVALGLGRLLGVPTPVNFDRPFRSASLTEFWQRWHASLGRFVRVHIFLPLQMRLVRAWGPRRAPLAAVLVLLVSFGFVGLWHGLHPALLAWGLGIGALLGLEKLVRDQSLRRGWAQQPALARLASVAGPLWVFVAMTLSLHPVWGWLL